MLRAKLRKNPPADVLYHGSNYDTDELEARDPGYGGSLGPGLYLTTDPDFAAIFGRIIYEVVSPVPDDRVAYIDVSAYDCSQSMQLYTPGSVPFVFEIGPQGGGETRRYTVLGDCDDEVKATLRGGALGGYKLSKELSDKLAGLPVGSRDVIRVAASKLVKAMAENARADDSIDTIVEDMAEGGADDDTLDATESFLEDVDADAEAHAGAYVEKRLGEEIDLDQISSVCQRLGYSAFFIDGYAPGNEYVIFDETYLPIAARKQDDGTEVRANRRRTSRRRNSKGRRNSRRR